MKPVIGFIGLGQMGKWMALNLVKAGFPLNFYARKKELIAEMTAAGAKGFPSPQELAKASTWMVFCLPNTDDVEEVLFGKDGMAAILQAGQGIIDCSTIHPLTTRKIADGLEKKGVFYLDAPISGMEARAKAGTLTIMAGGEEKVLEQVRPALEAMGNKIIHAGKSGNGQLMKLINQVLFDVHCAAMAELMPMAVKMGLDAEQTFAVARSGTAQSFALDTFGPLILEGNFKPGYHLEGAYKDMVHVTEISNTLRIPLPVTAATMVTYQMALDYGLGKENKGAMIKVWEHVLGVKVRKAERTE